MGICCHNFFDHLNAQVLLGLLGWSTHPAEGGGRLRGGEVSNVPRDLTITTIAPWDPEASSPVPISSSNRGDGDAMAETGFIILSSQPALSTVSTTLSQNSPDQIN